MIRTAVTVLQELLSRFLKDIMYPEFDKSLPDPELLKKETERYE